MMRWQNGELISCGTMPSYNEGAGCSSDAECSDNEACKSGICSDVCASFPCSPHKCVPNGFHSYECVECATNEDCPKDKTCRENICAAPCSGNDCSSKQQLCSPDDDHGYLCYGCTSDAACKDDEFCDETAKICRTLCPDACPDTAYCEIISPHTAECAECFKDEDCPEEQKCDLKEDSPTKNKCLANDCASFLLSKNIYYPADASSFIAAATGNEYKKIFLFNPVTLNASTTFGAKTIFTNVSAEWDDLYKKYPDEMASFCSQEDSKDSQPLFVADGVTVNLNGTALSAVDIRASLPAGAVQREDAPYTLKAQNADINASVSNANIELISSNKVYIKGSYLKINGGKYNTFNGINGNQISVQLSGYSDLLGTIKIKKAFKSDMPILKLSGTSLSGEGIIDIRNGEKNARSVLEMSASSSLGISSLTAVKPFTNYSSPVIKAEDASEINLNGTSSSLTVNFSEFDSPSDATVVNGGTIRVFNKNTGISFLSGIITAEIDVQYSGACRIKSPYAVRVKFQKGAIINGYTARKDGSLNWTDPPPAEYFQ